MRLIISVRGPASAYISLYPHDLSSLVTPSPAQPSHFLYVITDNDTALLMPGSADGGWMVWMPTLCMPRQHSQPGPRSPAECLPNNLHLRVNSETRGHRASNMYYLPNDHKSCYLSGIYCFASNLPAFL